MTEDHQFYSHAFPEEPAAPPPHGQLNEARNRELCIHPEYRHRPDAIAFDDRDQTDYWQNEVYEYAHSFALAGGCRRIIDYGCGSGFKLMKYFSGFEICGIEIEPALSFLKETYPGRNWVSGLAGGLFVGDLLIASDVIEHLADPIEFLQRIKESPLRYAILSTPALEILAERGESPRLGPPDNQSHINEWTTLEFRSFVEMHLRVIQHIVVSCKQGTQLIVAAPK